MSHPVLEAMLGTMEEPRLEMPTPKAQVMEADLEILPPLHSSGTKSRGIAKEKPIHRTIAYMLLSGASQRDVARNIGCSEGAISALVNSEWFREMLPLIAHTMGSSNVEELLKGAAAGAATVMIELTTNPDPRVKFSASKEILDRVFGKSVTRVASTREQVPVDPRDELKQLEKDIKELQEKVEEKTRL